MDEVVEVTVTCGTSGCLNAQPIVILAPLGAPVTCGVCDQPVTEVSPA